MFSHAEDWFLGSTAILFIWLYCKTNHLFLLSWVWPTSRASWWCWVAGSSVSQVVSECVSECVMSVMSVSFKIDFSLQSSTITSEINTCCCEGISLWKINLSNETKLYFLHFFLFLQPNNYFFHLRIVFYFLLPWRIFFHLLRLVNIKNLFSANLPKFPWWLMFSLDIFCWNYFQVRGRGGEGGWENLNVV